MQCVSGDVEVGVGRGIGGVLGLALGGVCAAQAPLGPHLLFKMKDFFIEVKAYEIL